MNNGGPRELEICHLLYADYTIIFCEAEADQVKYIRVILVVFEGVSGLKVNWRKSNLFPIKEVSNIQSLADILGCGGENLPIVYLGMPLGYKHNEVVIWDSIIEKTVKRLSQWKAQYLSLGGRVTLINSVLDSLPTYVMSLFPIPSSVAEKLDRLRIDFLLERQQRGGLIQSGQMGNDTLEQKSRRFGHQKFKIPQQMLANEVAIEIQ
ncbi:uncharacterized protein LOC129885509 [Solanum dulcamara]|uniref:uncharacterized protein LOC129885509 n=1 Tax=Solanum dulcamara TaxID=45834 RepID=UPI00248504FC|nr:uncharacterized protein LOC129885509 [Solanum dulcamara]